MSDSTVKQVGPTVGAEAAISGWFDLDVVITVKKRINKYNYIYFLMAIYFKLDI